MKRVILPALLLLLCVLPSVGQYRDSGARDARRTVARWYERFLGRQPDPHAAVWVDALRDGQEPEQVLSGILGSDEYYIRAGRTPARFVRQMHEDVTGREPSPREVRFWADQLYDRSRADIAYAFLRRQARNWDRDDHDGRDRYDYRRPYDRYR